MKYVPFAISEVFAVHAFSKLEGDVGGEVAFAAVDGADGVDQIFKVGVFEDVASGSGLEAPVDVFVGVVGGDDDDVGVGTGFTDAADGIDAFQVGHAQVHQGDIGLVLLMQLDGFKAVAGLGDDLEVVLEGEDGDDALADDAVVFGNENGDH